VHALGSNLVRFLYKIVGMEERHTWEYLQCLQRGPELEHRRVVDIFGSLSIRNGEGIRCNLNLVSAIS
jgi:hypothetical protein